MATSNGGAQPILVVGGGIGGLAAAYALSRQGCRVRVFEQSPEFREVGAGIQLGPNVFRVLEKIGLKEAILADAHIPPAQEMRDALTGKLITRIPLGDQFLQRFGQPYAVTHRADILGTFLKACQASNLITLENSRRVTGYEARASGVTALLDDGERADGRALIGCDGMWSQVRERIVGDGRPRVSGHIAYRAVLKREDVPADLWRPSPTICRPPSRPINRNAICAPRGCRSWRASTATSITRAASPPNCAISRSWTARRSNPTTGSPGSMTGREPPLERLTL